MSDDRTKRIFQTAMGLAASMTQHGSAVDELVALSEGDWSALDAARKRAETEAREAASERTAGVGDEQPPEAPARLASQLLRQAVDELSRRQNGT